ncbi:MAG: glycosyltransferase family 4 protein [Armatimonadota bacterium]
MIRVCHIVQSYYPRDPRIRRQAEALAEAGHWVVVYCLRGPKEAKTEAINGVRVVRLPLSRKRGSKLRYLFEYMAFFLMVNLKMCKKKFDVVHVSNLPDFLVFAALVPKILGAKVILDEHDPMPELFVSKYGMSPEHPVIKILKWLQKISMRFADRVLTVNDAMRELLEQHTGGRPVDVVMNLPDDKLFHADREKDCSNASSGTFTLLYTGTVSRIYGLSMVIEAVASVKSEIPGLRLKIAGEGDDLQALCELSEQLDIADSVEFLGIVSFKQIPELILQSDVGVSTLKLDPLTDLCFNNKTAEYIAMGLPAIVTRTRTVEKYYPEGIVRFFEPGNMESFSKAIVELYADQELRQQMSRKGIEFSKRSNWSTEKQKYLDLIESLAR